ncbi:MAG: HlyD family efflux transporter periplasmic adaptor subunit [Anaerolineae bacterium]|nr:HlyD family efflux transporter periplasmic adaptor subunit [Anaerolineae bacterium]
MRRSVRRAFLGLVLLLVALLALACRSGDAAQDEGVVETVTVERGSLVTSVTAVGSVRPGVEVALAPELSGRVVQVLVSEGERVQQGQPLIRLDTADLQLQVKSAEASLSAAQAQLAQLAAGPSAEEIRAAQGQVASAEAALYQAMAQRDQVVTGTTGADVVVARAQVDSARARVTQLTQQLEQSRAQDPTPDVTVAQVGVERAKIALDETQDEYNKALDRPWEDQSIRDGWAKKLQQARLDYRQAEAQLERALNAQRGYTLGLSVLQAQIEDARAALVAAEAQLGSAVSGDEPRRRAAEAAVDAARAQRDIAQAQLDALRAGATAYEIAIAQASVDQAQVALDSVRLKVERATLLAPFDGTVAAVDVAVGQAAGPQLPALTLVDDRRLSIEADVDEVDVGWLASGQEVRVTLDAFPGRPLTGSVVAILPSGTLDMGVVSYKVTVALAPTELPLRPGMTANTEIVRQRRDEVLVVTNRAIWIDSKTGQPFVEKLVGDEVAVVYVEQGLSNDESSEILSGLAEGDRLVVRSASIRDRFREVVTGSMTGQ